MPTRRRRWMTATVTHCLVFALHIKSILSFLSCPRNLLHLAEYEQEDHKPNNHNIQFGSRICNRLLKGTHDDDKHLSMQAALPPCATFSSTLPLLSRHPISHFSPWQNCMFHMSSAGWYYYLVTNILFTILSLNKY
jgi:hypothetical protein